MWYNSLMTWLLRSPLHGMLSKNTMLMTYTGRKSGQRITLPINYQRLKDSQGEYLLTTSFRHRVWWRNLRGGAPVTVRLQGKDYPAHSEVLEDPHLVATELAALLKAAPHYAKYLGVSLGQEALPRPGDTLQAAQTRVAIQTRLA